jgi:N-acetylneuraminate lyase
MKNFNFMADKFVKIYELFLDGKIQQAMLLQEKATAIITAIMRFGLSPSIKVILRDQGIDCGVCREPFKTLSEKDECELLTIVSKIERRDYGAY